MSEQLEAVEVRHDHIGDDNVRGEALDALDSLAAIGRRVGDVAPACHYFAETLPRRFFIVHYEHALVRHRKSLAHKLIRFARSKPYSLGWGRWAVASTLNDLSTIFRLTRLFARHRIAPLIRFNNRLILESLGVGPVVSASVILILLAFKDA